MTEWLIRHLERVRSLNAGLAVILDRDNLVDPASLRGQVEVIEDWWALRATYERHGRRRHSDDVPLVLLVRGALATEVLPWDIEHASTITVEVKLPGPPDIRAALRELDDDELDRAIAMLAGPGAAPAAALLRAVTGIDVRGAALSWADQLRVAARVALRSRPSTELAGLARRWVTDPEISGLIDLPPDTSGLQTVWNRFVAGGSTERTDALQQAQLELGALFTAGLLEPAATTNPPDGWARIGIRRPSQEERAHVMLDSAPAVPTDAVGWCAAAEWWGDVRRLIASGPTELKGAAWSRWEQLDAAFLPWLREHYGTLLSSAAPWPPAVHRIAHFLARRLRQGIAERVLLVVLDGLGHTQWAHLRERIDLDVLDAGSTMALVPTYTTVSRQAIFSGDLPVASPHSLWTTHLEPRRWREHWAVENFPVTSVAYHRVKGRLPHDRMRFGDALVVGIVVNAVDDLMHTSELFGDAQLLANLDVWAANGFLVDLVARATAEGFETWVTADHGNIECVGAGSVSEGVAIEAAGKRLLRYPNRTLRDASAASGIVWDDIPGMPPTAEPLLLAAGRSAFTNNKVSISHGGLSLDEVFVPLAKVAA